MKQRRAIWLLALSIVAVPAMGESSDRLSVTANGSTLTGPHGGAGVAVGLLHNFSEAAIAGAEVEYQTLADAHWTFGSLSGSYSRGAPGRRWNVSGELHEGAGNVGDHAFHYSIVAVGVGRSLGPRLSLQFEDRQIDVDTTHGNLPKLTASYAWTPGLQTSIAYANSVSGNLGTDLVTLRLDRYSTPWNWFVGGAAGKASPEVVNLKTGVVRPGNTLREGFAGIARPVGNAKLTLVADYLDLGGTKRVTLTVNYIVGLGGRGSPR
jgi:hypothetical protein